MSDNFEPVLVKSSTRGKWQVRVWDDVEHRWHWSEVFSSATKASATKAMVPHAANLLRLIAAGLSARAIRFWEHGDTLRAQATALELTIKPAKQRRTRK